MNERLAEKEKRERLESGRRIEQLIYNRLQQIGFNLRKPNSHEDMTQKVDAWYHTKENKRVGIQIKFRQSGSDLLFEVYDTFVDFKHPQNKLGRDMIGCAELYAVMVNDELIVVKKQKAIDAINEMMDEARCNGWSGGRETKTLYYESEGHELVLKMQSDPHDGRKKIVAYIPKQFFDCVEYSMSA